MAGRGLSKALRCRDCVLKHVTPIQQRTFASSPACQKHGAVPTFSETSSPELDSILTTFRNKVFLPVHLSKPQRDLVYGLKHQRMLTIEPVITEIDGEKFRLEYIDRTKDLPDTIKGLYAAINLMKDKSDWDNLPALLQGLKNAGRKLRPTDPSKITRKAGKAGRQDVMLECARRVSDTGFSLKDPELVAEFMWWIQHKALQSNWGANQTKQALTWAEMVSVMLEDPRHSGNRVLAGETDPRVRPEVIGILLQLAAVRAVRHLDRKDGDGKVAEYADRLLGTSLDMNPRPKDAKTPPTLHDINHYLSAVAPVLHGMKVALTVLDPASKAARELKAKTTELEKATLSHRDVLLKEGSKETMLRGLWILEHLLGPKLP